jgi:uncharacterized membrane protein YedE/YeeE
LQPDCTRTNTRAFATLTEKVKAEQSRVVVISAAFALPARRDLLRRLRRDAREKEHRPMHNFTPLSGFLGGALIGLAAAALMLLTGRIAGISGIFGGLLTPGTNDRGWRLAFIVGLIAAPLIAALATGIPLPAPAMPASLILVIVAGLLVGFGSRMGGGCTSGHGVCGIGRVSARSIAATAIFMAAAIATVAIMRHVIGG